MAAKTNVNRQILKKSQIPAGGNVKTAKIMRNQQERKGGINAKKENKTR